MEKHRWSKEEIAEYREKRGSYGFYCNRQDTNVFVPKSFGMGFTVNWANPWGWAVIAAIIVAIVCIKLYYR